MVGRINVYKVGLYKRTRGGERLYFRVPIKFIEPYKKYRLDEVGNGTILVNEDEQGDFVAIREASGRYVRIPFYDVHWHYGDFVRITKNKDGSVLIEKVLYDF